MLYDILSLVINAIHLKITQKFLFFLFANNASDFDNSILGHVKVILCKLVKIHVTFRTNVGFEFCLNSINEGQSQTKTQHVLGATVYSYSNKFHAKT